jgi:hypothetical protein
MVKNKKVLWLSVSILELGREVLGFANSSRYSIVVINLRKLEAKQVTKEIKDSVTS